MRSHLRIEKEGDTESEGWDGEEGRELGYSSIKPVMLKVLGSIFQSRKKKEKELEDHFGHVTSTVNNETRVSQAPLATRNQSGTMLPR